MRYFLLLPLLILLLENASEWTTGEAGATIPDYSQVRENPEPWRGKLCLIEGVLLSQLPELDLSREGHENTRGLVIQIDSFNKSRRDLAPSDMLIAYLTHPPQLSAPRIQLDPNMLAEDQAWYYDVVTGEVFAARAKQIPPIQSPDGHEAVRVFFFSCGECTEGERFAGYYMKYTAAMKQQLDADPAKFAAAFGESHPGRLFSADGQTWVEAPTVKESGVAEYLANRCNGTGSYLRSCRRLPYFFPRFGRACSQPKTWNQIVKRQSYLNH